MNTMPIGWLIPLLSTVVTSRFGSRTVSGVVSAGDDAGKPSAAASTATAVAERDLIANGVDSSECCIAISYIHIQERTRHFGTRFPSIKDPFPAELLKDACMQHVTCAALHVRTQKIGQCLRMNCQRVPAASSARLTVHRIR